MTEPLDGAARTVQLSDSPNTISEAAMRSSLVLARRAVCASLTFSVALSLSAQQPADTTRRTGPKLGNHDVGAKQRLWRNKP